MSIHANISSFNLALLRYGSKEIPALQQGRLTVIALTGAKMLTELTPVDQGRAKGNWQFTVGEPAEGEVDRLDPRPQGTPATEIQGDILKRINDWKPGAWLWFHNGVPYISVLNDGDDSRTPHHMLERTVEYLQNWLSQGG